MAPLDEAPVRKLCTDCGLSRTNDPKRCGQACQFIQPDYPGLEPEPDYPDYPGNLNQTKDYEYGENEENFDEAEYKEEGNNEGTEVSFFIGCYYEIGCGEFPSHIITKIILTL
jgi:hypothetical protein